MRWTTIAAFVGLLLIGILSVINSVELARLADQNPIDPLNAQVQVLATHVADLARQVEQARKRLDAVPLTRYDAEIETVEQRLATIEQTLNERPNDDLPPLRDRLTQLEERLTQFTALTATPAPIPPSARPTPSPQPKAAEPPFQVVGVERRADERFLAILPVRANSLSQVRLLRVGDRENGWRLDAIDDVAVTFSHAGKTRRLSLP
jgi:outer membrane murein-binding lipoprotein Lpp